MTYPLISLEVSSALPPLETKMVAFRFHQYQVVGRALPTEKDVQPKIYRMKLWATNEVRAKSKFWYFLRKLKKVKKSNGQMLAINEIFEKNPTTIKNFGIWLRYQSRTGYHNMYKEYRDTTLNGAVEQMYTEMASRHRVRFPCIQIIKTATVPAKLCKRESTKQFHNSKIKFPLVFRKVRPPSRKLKTTYKASKPNLFIYKTLTTQLTYCTCTLPSSYKQKLHSLDLKSHDVIYAEEEATGTYLLIEDLLNCLDRLEFSFLKWQEYFAVLATTLPKDLKINHGKASVSLNWAGSFVKPNLYDLPNQ
ncbi:hypothetical protein HID58_009771 [Brassica napus]|uniref:Large ribosomal subunit protein eL20 domain-containing protein n=1 Tax=Brassica napus TaxID=3708 RepID=A0ABQ8DTJ3_BRANA|nr:hypothetical protein HID58_009771 [Brassica napus]